jgi:hypothetical protein
VRSRRVALCLLGALAGGLLAAPQAREVVTIAARKAAARLLPQDSASAPAESPSASRPGPEGN